MAVTTAPLISLDNVSRIFDDGSVVALDGIDMSIARGEFVSIVGPSGSGKSSLVHMMAGFDRPTGGRVLWQGEEVSDRRAWTQLRRSQIGIVFQEFLLLPTLSAIENVEIAMSGTGLAAPARKKRAAELLEQVGLGGALQRICRSRCPAASASAWRSPAALPTGRSCCCRTSRPATSTAPTRRR